MTSLLLVLTMFLTSCGGFSNHNASGQGGTLTMVPSPIGDYTRNFNIFANGSVLSGTQGLIYETLLFFNRENGSVSPWLASSYQISSDATRVTFHLRPGVQWSDGKPFTSADVVFTLNLVRAHPAIDYSGLWNMINTVTAPDAHTVVVTLKQPWTPILWYLGGQTYIVPEHLWSNATNPVTYTNPNPVGTGPFILKSFTPQLYVFGRNPHYWQPGKPSINEIRYPSFNSNTSADLLLSQGSVDWTGLFTPDINKTFVNRDPANNHYWFPPSNVVALYPNLTKYPFNVLAVRQAISAAIDRNKLSRIGENGYEPPAHPTGLVLPANQSYLSPRYAGASFSLDTTRANSLLEQAGFKKGSDGIYVDKNGRRLAFNINVVSGWTDWVTDSQIIASNLQAVGMDVKVNTISFNSYYSALQTGTFDTAISWTSPGPTPYYLYDSMLASNNTAPIGQPATSNFERWSDPTTDKLLQQYASSPNPAVQQQALEGLQKIMVEQMPTIPLIYGATWYEYSTKNFVGWPDQQHPYAMPAPYSAPDVEIVVLNLHPA
ncbi:MAG TPA: ABC transporter substrate-binding protein [Ktedonobacteraceae bacterium]|nr:ABC transporter substrate-binding protein [Ktedonobacteraceae bacterium]